MKQIDTAALAHRIAKWDTNLSTAPHRIKQEIDATLEPLLVEAVMRERAATVRFIRAVANDVRTIPDASRELFSVAKSIEASFHLVMTEKG